MEKSNTLKLTSIFRYIGPGLLITVGFIDPGNWASNVAAGSEYGYTLLWMVTLSTIMLIILQHNVAHLGIVTGKCLAESTSIYLKPRYSRPILSSALLAAIATALAEILGGAIALQMLFKLPMYLGATLVSIFVLIMLFTNSYIKLEKIIIGFVSIIGFSFIYELSVVDVSWNDAIQGWFTISFPEGSMAIIMAVLGAVVMPHNLFLHSEIIQSRKWNKEDDKIIKRQLKFEFFDTMFSMIVGWAINSAMIILAATTFYKQHIVVDDLAQAQNLLVPIVGQMASLVFAIALLFSGISSSITAAIAGGSIYAGIFSKPYNIKDNHTRFGVILVLTVATLIIYIISDSYKGLLYSQIFLSIQLPITVILQIYLTSSKKVMGKYKNTLFDKITLNAIAVILIVLNIMLLISTFNEML